MRRVQQPPVIVPPPPRMPVIAWVVVALTLGGAAPTRAEPVHKCRIDGRTVFQSAACPASDELAAPATAASASLARPAAPASASGHGHGTAASSAPRGSGDGATVLRSRMGAM